MKSSRYLALLSRPSLCALALGLLLALAGCTQVQVDQDTRGQFKLGELQVFADRDFARVYDAAKAALKESNVLVTHDDRKVIEAELRARDAADTLIVVKIKEVSKNRTSVKIRYGIVSNSLAQAQALYAKMEKRF